MFILWSGSFIRTQNKRDKRYPYRDHWRAIKIQFWLIKRIKHLFHWCAVLVSEPISRPIRRSTISHNIIPKNPTYTLSIGRSKTQKKKTHIKIYERANFSASRLSVLFVFLLSFCAFNGQEKKGLGIEVANPYGKWAERWKWREGMRNWMKHTQL